MKRLFNFSVLGFLILSLTVSMGWAGTTTVDDGTAATVGLETLGAARSVTIEGATAGNGAVAYRLTQNLVTNNLLTVSFYGGLAFNGSTVVVCAKNNGVFAANNIGHAIPSAGATTQDIQIDLGRISAANVSAGNILWLATSTSGAIACNTAAANNMVIQVGTGAASVGTKNIGIQGRTSGGIVIDPEGTAAAANVVNEFAGTVYTRNMVFDYLGAQSSDGTLFEISGDNTGGANNVAAVATALNLAVTTVDYSSVIGTQNAGLTVGGLVNFDANTNWSGVSKVWAIKNGGAYNCSHGSSNANSNVVSAPNGAVALALTSAAFNGSETSSISICIQVDGSTPLSSRDIVGSYNIEVTGPGANDPSEAAASWQTWRPNGWQGFLPHMRFGSTTRTYVRVVNNNTRAGLVFADIVLPDGTALDRIQIGTIGAGETVTYNAETIASLAGITTIDNYAMLMSITQQPANIFCNAFFNLLEGGVWTTRNVTLYEANKSTAYTMK